VQLTWRVAPRFTVDEDGSKIIRMRLAFEPVEPDDV
jgi:hypothetical protein